MYPNESVLSCNVTEDTLISEMSKFEAEESEKGVNRRIGVKVSVCIKPSVKRKFQLKIANCTLVMTNCTKMVCKRLFFP